METPRGAPARSRPRSFPAALPDPALRSLPRKPLQGQLANVEHRINQAGGGFQTSQEPGIFINTGISGCGGTGEKTLQVSCQGRAFPKRCGIKVPRLCHGVTWGHSRVSARLGCSRSGFRSGFRSSFSSRFSSSRNSCSATTVSHLATQRRHRALPVAVGDSVSQEGTLELGSGCQGFFGMVPRIRFPPRPRLGPVVAAVRCPSLRAADASPEPHLSMTGPAHCRQSLPKRGKRGIWGRGDRARRAGGAAVPWDRSPSPPQQSTPHRHRGLPPFLHGNPAPAVPAAAPVAPQGRWALLELSFCCLSLASLRLPPLGSAACQGAVTNGWVGQNRSGPI